MDLAEAFRPRVRDSEEIAVQPDLLRIGLVMSDEQGAVAAEAEKPLGGAAGRTMSRR